MRPRLNGARLRVAVAMSDKGGEASLEVASAASAAAAQPAGCGAGCHAARCARATPRRAECRSAHRQGRLGTHTAAAGDRAGARPQSAAEASPLALSARTRRALCGGGGCLDVAALVRLRNIERLADAEARIAALITAHVRAAAAAVAAGAVAAAARAETGVRRRGCCYPTADSPRTKPAPAPSLKPSRLGPAPPTVALRPPPRPRLQFTRLAVARYCLRRGAPPRSRNGAPTSGGATRATVSRDARCRGIAPHEGRRQRHPARATCTLCACSPEAQREVASARRRCALAAGERGRRRRSLQARAARAARGGDWLASWGARRMTMRRCEHWGTE